MKVCDLNAAPISEERGIGPEEAFLPSAGRSAKHLTTLVQSTDSFINLKARKGTKTGAKLRCCI